ncbi:MAG: 3-phosphoshikimate 1-carboxyvinyltransferase [Syntrophothermus sp.]
MDFRVFPAKRGLKGEIQVPGDKSISHRAVMLGGLANGATEVSNFLAGEDCLNTVKIFRQLGVEIRQPESTRLIIDGRGLKGLAEAGDILDVGNSGTSFRLLLGILSGQPFYSVLTGDASIRRRPMGRVTEPLQRMGARIAGRNGGKLAPLSVMAAPEELRPIVFSSPVASAQVKSAIILAGLYASGETMVVEPARSRDHTERMLQAFGANIKIEGLAVSCQGGATLQGRKLRVPGDISSAAFFIVGASIVEGSDLVIREVGLNPTRTGLLDALSAMGSKISISNLHDEAGEPVGDIRVQTADLHGVEVSGELIPRLIDEIPILAVAALFARGATVIRDAAELRVKESDRIQTIYQGLSRLGGEVEILPDGLVIHGGGALAGAHCESHGDHRIAMAAAIAGLKCTGETTVHDIECTATSFPGFGGLLAGLTGSLEYR